jgi:hypothetical protein
MARPITKSDYLTGIQCPLRLWSRHHAPIPYEGREETPAMRAGTDVGLLAHRLFPGGAFVEAKPWERDLSVAQTQALLADKNVPVIFEAGVLHDGLHVRIDILKRKPSGGLALYEVKSSGEVKPQHIPDLAFQLHVARGSGLQIDEAGIIHVNKDYERGAELDVSGLFTSSDETASVEEHLAANGGEIARQKQVLTGQTPSQDRVGIVMIPINANFGSVARKTSRTIGYSISRACEPTVTRLCIDAGSNPSEKFQMTFHSASYRRGCARFYGLDGHIQPQNCR